MPETGKLNFGHVNVTYQIHTQRSLLEYRATIHRATRTPLASLWKALDDIYETYMRLLHSFAPLRPQNFSRFSSRNLIITYYYKKIAKLLQFSCRFVLKACTNFIVFTKIIQKMLFNIENLKKIVKHFLTRVIFELDTR